MLGYSIKTSATHVKYNNILKKLHEILGGEGITVKFITDENL